MPRSARSRGRRECGQALVEFALAASLFLLLLLAVMQLALLGNARLTILHASREGVRYASVAGAATDAADAQTKDAAIKNYIIAKASALRSPALQAADITISPAGVARASGSNITVTIAYDAQATVPLISPLLPSGINLGASSTVRIE